MRVAQWHLIWRCTVMQRVRWTKILLAVAISLSGCLNATPPEGAQSEIDDTASTGPQVAVEAARPTPSHGSLPAEVPPPCSGNPSCGGGGPPPATVPGS